MKKSSIEKQCRKCKEAIGKSDLSAKLSLCMPCRTCICCHEVIESGVVYYVKEMVWINDREPVCSQCYEKWEEHYSSLYSYSYNLDEILKESNISVQKKTESQQEVSAEQSQEQQPLQIQPAYGTPGSPKK